MQSSFAPSVTPRPAKGPLTVSRGGRTYSPSVSPIKVPPGTSSKTQGLLRAAEPASSALASAPSPVPSSLRKKPLILSGDIRNLGSNFQLATAKEPVSLAHVGDVLATHGVVISRAEAQGLRHEFEENNDRGLSYAAFVAELAQSLRGPASGTSDSGTTSASGVTTTSASRALVKKPRLAEHLSRLSARQAQLVEEVRVVLRSNLRVSWQTVRDACRDADSGSPATGKLPKASFARILVGFQVPALSQAALEALSRDGRSVDYYEFLAQFGSSFQHGDTNSVGNSLVFERPPGKPVAEVTARDGAHNIVATNKTLQSPGVSSALGGKQCAEKSAIEPESIPVDSVGDTLMLEKLRIVVGEKLVKRSGEILSAFEAQDPTGSSVLPAVVFSQALRDLHLVQDDEELSVVVHQATGADGNVDYRAFVSKFGELTVPPARPGAATIKHMLQENSSLVFTGNKDVKGAHKNRVALSSPGNELKEAFSRLPDASWRAIHVELELSDPRKGGLVPAAEMLRVLGKHLGELPSRHFNALFRACGSHAHQLMDYRALVKSYRPRVADTVSYFEPTIQGEGAAGATAVGKQHGQQATAPTESLVLVWSVRVARAQVGAAQWRALQDRLASCDPRRQGRVSTPAFALAVREALGLTEAQTAFLCYFYEDRSVATDTPLIRYASFLTDYEDPGLEPNDPSDVSGNLSKSGGGRTTGAFSSSNAASGPSMGDAELELGAELERLRVFFRSNVRELEARLVGEDTDRRGFVSSAVFTRICAKISADGGGRWRDTRASAKLLARYIARGGQFYYRGFLLDMDGKAGLQTHGLVVQDDDSDDEDDQHDGEPRDTFDVSESGDSERLLDVHEARAAIRQLLTSSRPQQSGVYRLLSRMDPSGSGLLTYPELRRALERLGVAMKNDAVVQDLLGFYEEEDARGEKSTGQIKYLQFLHALGGRDPDKVGSASNASDLSSHCSYYSAVGISPRAVRRSQTGAVAARQLSSRASHVLAAQAVSASVANPRAAINAGLGASSGGATAVERKLQEALKALGKTAWRQLARKLQALDSEKCGSVAPSSLRKVLGELGVVLDQEEVVRLQLKYDVEQNGRLNYHALLRQLTSALSDFGGGISSGGGDTLPSLAITSPIKTQASDGAVNMPEDLRQSIQAQWKAVYASFKALDKGNTGRVSAAHFRQLLQWYALPVTDSSFLAVLRQFDNADGLVEYNRFMRACFRG